MESKTSSKHDLWETKAIQIVKESDSTLVIQFADIVPRRIKVKRVRIKTEATIRWRCSQTGFLSSRVQRQSLGASFYRIKTSNWILGSSLTSRFKSRTTRCFLRITNNASCATRTRASWIGKSFVRIQRIMHKRAKKKTAACGLAYQIW